MYRPIVGNIPTTDNNSSLRALSNPVYKNQFRGDYVANGDITQQSDTIAPDYPIPETKYKQHTIVINSIDRNWSGNNNENPYNFLIKLGGTGFDRFSTVSHDYKNVVSVNIDKIILPNRPCIQSYISNVSPRLNDYPYLTLNISGINYSSYGTNKTLNNTIGIYTPLIPLPSGLSDITYLEFKNTSIQKKDYEPAPEAYISALDLHINSPSGDVVSNLNDVLEIYSIFLNTSSYTIPMVFTSGDSLTIQTDTYFNNVEFRPNDLIKIANYQYHNNSYDECAIFNNWINRDSGHNIISIGKSNNATSLYNKINIPLPASLSTITGNIAVETWFSDLVMKSLSNVAIEDVSGKLINANLQSHLVVNMKTLEKEDRIFLKDFKF